MSQYLTFLGSRSLFSSKTYPDENFAREIMQLFTIGLWKLNEDGTQFLDEQGAPVMTYTNDDIVTLSRAWTGHTRQEQRGNLENYDGTANGGRNDIDPLRLMPHWSRC